MRRRSMSRVGGSTSIGITKTKEASEQKEKRSPRKLCAQAKINYGHLCHSLNKSGKQLQRHSAFAAVVFWRPACVWAMYNSVMRDEAGSWSDQVA